MSTLQRLSAFVNLEYLSVSCFRLVDKPFVGLHKLKRLDLDNCLFYDSDPLVFKDLENLQVLSLRMPLKYHDIDLSHLVNLKYLKIDIYDDAKFLRTVTPDLEVLEIIIFSRYKDNLKFAKNLGHFQKLRVFKLIASQIAPRFDINWFANPSLLENLYIDCYLRSIDLNARNSSFGSSNNTKNAVVPLESNNFSL